MKYRFKLNILGKLNLIILGLIGLLIVALMIKVWKQKDEYIDVEVQVTGLNGWQQGTEVQPPSWLIDSIKEGDEELSYSGKKLAVVLDIEGYEEGNNNVTFLKLRLLINRNKKQNTFRYKQKPLEVGTTLDVLLKNTRIYGSVTTIYGEGEEEKTKYKKIKIILYGKQPWLADSINVGDSVRSGFNEEKIQSKVLSKVIKNSYASGTVSSVAEINNSRYGLVDIELEMKLLVDERQGLNYFANYQPIKVGNLLYIPMKDYNLYGAQEMKIEDDN